MPDSEPLGYAIAERRPCPFDDFNERACRMNCGLPCGTAETGADFGVCLGDGTRWVVTDVEVEQRFLVYDEYGNAVVLSGGCWREVES